MNEKATFGIVRQFAQRAKLRYFFQTNAREENICVEIEFLAEYSREFQAMFFLRFAVREKEIFPSVSFGIIKYDPFLQKKKNKNPSNVLFFVLLSSLKMNISKLFLLKELLEFFLFPLQRMLYKFLA